MDFSSPVTPPPPSSQSTDGDAKDDTTRKTWDIGTVSRGTSYRLPYPGEVVLLSDIRQGSVANWLNRLCVTCK